MHSRSIVATAQPKSAGATERSKRKPSAAIADRRPLAAQLTQLAALANPATRGRAVSAAPAAPPARPAPAPLQRRTAATSAVVQRMTLPEYEAWVRANDGDSVLNILERGWAAAGGSQGEHKEHKRYDHGDFKGGGGSAAAASSGSAAAAKRSLKPGEADPDDPRLMWRNARGKEIIKVLGRVPLADFLRDRKLQQAVQMMVGQVGRGEPMLEPPSGAAALASNSNLYRGTTIDTATGAPYVGSGGSKAGSPTTPSAVIAALFATKSATENSAKGVIIYGSARNVQQHGFVAPDVMSGQEQEITVNADPVTTNAALGGQLDLDVFRKALSLVGENVPPALRAGEDFDSRLIRAARKGLDPAMDSRLRELLSNPEQMIPRWSALLAETEELAGRLSGLEGMLERKKKTHDIAPAQSMLEELNTLVKHIKGAPTFQVAAPLVARLSDGIAAFAKLAGGLKPLASAAAKPDSDEEDFDPFAD